MASLRPVGGHVEVGVHLQAVPVESVAGEVPAGVERHTGGQGPDEQLRGRGGPVVPAQIGRLVHAYPVAAYLDLVRFAVEEVDVDALGLH